jgi:peptide/nickel transport system substrate-binding protein
VFRLFSTLALALVLIGTTGTARAERTELVIGVTQFPPSLNPALDSSVAQTYLLGMARRPFTVFDQDWKLICLLCTGLPSFENGLAVKETLDDGTTGVAVTYTIHPDASWADGTPVTSEDVVFTWELGRQVEVGFVGQEGYTDILAVDVIDDKTFTLHVNKLDYQYQSLNGFTLLPAHVERAAAAVPAEYRHKTAYDRDPTNPGLWNGPYRITAIETGSYVVLEPNPYWWGAKPQFTRITVRTIENTSALEANLLSGAVDYVSGELGFDLDQAVVLEQRYGDRYDVTFKPGLQYEHIDVLLENPILADLRVRQALLHGVNRAGIVASLFEGKNVVANGFVHPLDPMHADDLPAYDYDTGKAVELLEAAGWTTLGDDGIRRNDAGERLSLVIMTTSGNQVRELVEQVLQNEWQKIGVEAVIQNQPPRVLFGGTISHREYKGLAMYAWLSSPENLPKSTLYSSRIPTPENGWSGQNYTGFSSPEMDKLIDAAEIELDLDKRKALWRQIQMLYAEELPVLPLYFRALPYVTPKWLTGIRPTGNQFPSTLWVEEWRADD